MVVCASPARQAAQATARSASLVSLTHLNEAGEARMVDVGDKPVTAREAVAEALPPYDSGGLPEATTSEEPPSSCVLPSFIRLSSVLSDSGGNAGDGGDTSPHGHGDAHRLSGD